MTIGSRSSADLRRRRIRQFWWIGLAAAVGVALVYLIAVRTEVGQRFDDLAFEGRAVADPEVTRVANELLHTVTKSTLALLTLALLIFGLARRQVRLALTTGATVAASVVTSVRQTPRPPPQADLVRIWRSQGAESSRDRRRWAGKRRVRVR